MQPLESTVSRQAIIREMEPEELEREYAKCYDIYRRSRSLYTYRQRNEARDNADLIRSQYLQITGTEITITH